MEPHFEFEHAGRRFTVQTERQPGRSPNDLYYRGHFLQTQVSSSDATRVAIMAQFIAWLADHPISPYECHGGPLDGELVDDRGSHFVVPDVSAGRYRRHEDDYEWEQ